MLQVSSFSAGILRTHNKEKVISPIDDVKTTGHPHAENHLSNRIS